MVLRLPAINVMNGIQAKILKTYSELFIVSGIQYALITGDPV
jgi:hypothetical protein